MMDKRNDSAAFSPIVGVILMLFVGILIVFVIGSGVFGSSPSGDSPDGDLVFSELSEGEVEIVLTDVERLDSLTIDVDANDGSSVSSITIPDVSSGNTFYYCGGEDGDMIIINGEYKGVEQILERYTVNSGAGGAGTLQTNEC